MRRTALFVSALLLAHAAVADEPEVIVFGGTPCGIAASVAAAREGRSVILLEPTRHIGGMVTSGLSHTDFRTFEGVTGFYLTFAKRVEDYYREKYGPDSVQLKQCWRGLQAEPHVNEAVFEAMIAELPGIKIEREVQLTAVEREGNVLKQVRYRRGKAEHEHSAKVFIDASYEGDLMALAKVPFRVGREGREEYGESLAPEKADDQLQAYNFRFIATDDPANRVPLSKPEGYRREDFAEVLSFFESGKLKSVFGYPSGCVVKAHLPLLPNRKYDLNDVSRGIVRMSMPGRNLAWPDGDAITRAGIFQEHLRYNAGLLYFLQYDEAAPAAIREAALQYGWAKDEFTDNAHLPWQLYVREARRMVGQRIFTESDSDHAPGDARAVLHADSIGIGDYGNNCHGTFHEGPLYGGEHTGEFYKSVPPYQVPYATLVPKDVTNLLVPGAPSATHVGFCALRLEPIWGVMGEAAGIAASVAIQDGSKVQDVGVSHVQSLMHEHGAATIYVSDVLPGDALFVPVQKLGLLGGLHGLHPMPETPGQRGANIDGQYFEAYPFHAFQPDLALDESLFQRWKTLAPELVVANWQPGMTRRQAFSQKPQSTRKPSRP